MYIQHAIICLSACLIVQFIKTVSMEQLLTLSAVLLLSDHLDEFRN